MKVICNAGPTHLLLGCSAMMPCVGSRNVNTQIRKRVSRKRNRKRQRASRREKKLRYSSKTPSVAAKRSNKKRVMQKRKATANQGPNLPKLRTSEEEKKHACFKGGINCSTSQQSARKVLTTLPSQQHPAKKQRPSIAETGQSSGSRSSGSRLFCKICMESKRPTEIFTIKQCRHAFCSECVSQHVAAKIQENSPSVQCPEPSCKGVLEPILLQPILPPDVFDRWGSVMCESLIQESMKFYCPFKDCSGLLVDERKKDGVVILESECPHCNRLFCAKCKVPWHSGISCDNFQKLGKHERDREDIMLMNLAKSKKWQRCPQCGFYVEKIEGCLFMKCRCSYCFCYHCAGPSDPKYHYCPRCRR